MVLLPCSVLTDQVVGSAIHHSLEIGIKSEYLFYSSHSGGRELNLESYKTTEEIRRQNNERLKSK